MPASRDPEKRRRQLANLPNLRGEPAATSWRPGDAPHLEHGARSRRPHQSPEWSPAVEAAIRDLEERVGAELRDQEGSVHRWAVPSIEAVALQRVAAWRVDRYLADREAKGGVKPEAIELASRVTDRYHRALEREALTLRSRLEASRQSIDLASAMSEPDPERRRRLMADAGLELEEPDGE